MGYLIGAKLMLEKLPIVRAILELPITAKN